LFLGMPPHFLEAWLALRVPDSRSKRGADISSQGRAPAGVEGMAMNQVRVGLLVAAAIFAVPLGAAAQPAKSDPAKAGDKPAGEKAAGDKAAGDQPTGDQPTGDQPTGDTGTGGDDGGGLADICKIDPKQCGTVDLKTAAARPLNPKMYAMQQRYILHQRRFELNPYFGLTMNDQFVAHPAIGLSVAYYITNWMGVGISGHYYLNSPSDFNFQTSRAARVGEPITEYQWNANANFIGVPAYGKFAGFGDFIFHYDFFLQGGIGATSTRPIAVVDPDNRTFDFTPRITFNVGGGLRIFFNRWLALTLQVQDYIFPEELENPLIAKGVDAQNKPKAQLASTWTSPDSSITNNVQAQIGLSFYLPPGVKYAKPK
jgi:outer membrane beta-barrel protein